MLITDIFIYSGSLSLEFSQNTMTSDELQPCIEDIRLEIDRLRRAEQLLRERFVV